MPTFGITGALGNLYGSDSELYGRKPIVPDAIDYSKALEEDIATNKRILPQLTELAGMSTDALTAMLEKTIPGYKSLRDQTTANISSMSRGELPEDVSRLLQQRSAEAGISLGTSGSQHQKFDELRNLGLASLDVTQRGIDAASRWIQQAQGRTFDFSRMFLGKEESVRRTEFNWNRDWLAAQVKAAPDPAVRGAFDSEMAFLGEVLSIYGGGAGYTGQYRPSYGGGGGGAAGMDNQRGGGSFFGTGNYNYSPNPNPGSGGGYSDAFAQEGPQ